MEAGGGGKAEAGGSGSGSGGGGNGFISSSMVGRYVDELRIFVNVVHIVRGVFSI